MIEQVLEFRENHLDNPAFERITTPILLNDIDRINQFIKEGFANTRTEFIRSAIVFYYRKILNEFLKKDIIQIEKDLTKHPTKQIALNIKHTMNRIALDLGNPRKIIEGKIYELRFHPTKQYIKSCPRWCYIGDESERENPTFKI